MPDPDPGEELSDVASQISGNMGGFLAPLPPPKAGVPPDSTRPNANQRAIHVAAHAHARGRLFTREQWARVSERLRTLGDLRRFPVPSALPA